MLTLIDRLKWPLTLLLSLALVAIAVLILGGDALGIDPEVRREVMTWLRSGAAALAALVVPMILALLRRDEDGDGIPDVLQPRKRKPRATIRPPVDVLLACVLAGSALHLTACGPSAIGTQADLVALGAIATAGADEALVAERARALDAVVSRAEAECPSGCAEERAEAYRVELAATEARWAPVLACRLPVVEALRSWVDALDTARTAATESVGLSLLVRLGLRFATAYTTLTACVEAAAPDVDLPVLPAALTALGGE